MHEQGEFEHEQILAVIKEVDIVICALPYPQVMEQLKIIDAIKVAGNIKVSIKIFFMLINNILVLFQLKVKKV